VRLRLANKSNDKISWYVAVAEGDYMSVAAVKER